MKIYFLNHTNLCDETECDAKAIGYYTSYERAKEVREEYKKKPGFCDHTDEFHIEILDFEENTGELYCVYLFHSTPDETIEYTYGYFPSYELAKAAYDQVKLRKVFCDHVESIYITDIPLNKESWVEGFDTYTYYD